eukprot:g31984.t1
MVTKRLNENKPVQRANQQPHIKPKLQIFARTLSVAIACRSALTCMTSDVEVRNEFYKDTQGVILVYDVGLKDSFDALEGWLTEMKQELGPHGNMENIVFIVCANKVKNNLV